MTRMEWGKAGHRFFEAGVDRVVLYPRSGPGVAWPGVINVIENTTGGEIEPLYFDGVKFADVPSSEEFESGIDAFAAPPEFDAAQGIRELAPGLSIGQQPKQSFGLSYRSLVGNDLLGIDYGYKIHLVYNCMAGPSGKTNASTSDQVAPVVKSWTISTVPPKATTFKPVAHISLDSTKIDEAVMAAVENILYGTPATDPRQPTIAEVAGLLS